MENNVVEILLIEDNPNDAEMAIHALKQSKIANNIVHLQDGALALDFLFGQGDFSSRDTEYKPKLILLDLKMPKVDGIEVLRIIKTEDLTKRIPVVVLTSSRENPDAEECYKLGVNSYIVKPVEYDNFVKSVADVGLYWLLINHLP